MAKVETIVREAGPLACTKLLSADMDRDEIEAEVAE
jgi:hypothetical protein